MYSQQEEEKIILEYFRNEDPKCLTFLDIGANDGITFSNVRRLALNDWSGCLVEPSPKAYVRLASNYLGFKKIKTFFFGISDTPGQLEFYESGNWVHDPHTPPSLLSTLHLDSKLRFFGMNWEVIKCNFVTFDFFLSLRPAETFDFISIDVEGHEMNVLKQMDLKKLGCRLICLEHAGDVDKLEQFKIHCGPFGFREIWCGIDNIILSL